jgi:hypothetical protein
MGRNCSAGARLRVTPAGSRRQKPEENAAGLPKNSTPTSHPFRARRFPACRLRRDKDLIFGHL